MAKNLTRKQQNEQRIKREQEAARTAKLLASRTKSPRKRDAVDEFGDPIGRSVTQLPDYSYDDPTKAYKSVITKDKIVQVLPDDYSDSPELQAREVEAQREKDRKRKRVGVLFNKGPVQYITDETDPTTIGRK